MKYPLNMATYAPESPDSHLGFHLGDLGDDARDGDKSPDMMASDVLNMDYGVFRHVDEPDLEFQRGMGGERLPDTGELLVCGIECVDGIEQKMIEELRIEVPKLYGIHLEGSGGGVVDDKPSDDLEDMVLGEEGVPELTLRHV